MTFFGVAAFVFEFENNLKVVCRLAQDIFARRSIPEFEVENGFSRRTLLIERRSKRPPGPLKSAPCLVVATPLGVDSGQATARLEAVGS